MFARHEVPSGRAMQAFRHLEYTHCSDSSCACQPHVMLERPRPGQGADAPAAVQTALKDFQNTMKVARSKEASSLPKPTPAELAKLQQGAADPLEQAEGGRGDPLESAALLQVYRLRVGSCRQRTQLLNVGQRMHHLSSGHANACRLHVCAVSGTVCRGTQEGHC